VVLCLPLSDRKLNKNVVPASTLFGILKRKPEQKLHIALNSSTTDLRKQSKVRFHPIIGREGLLGRVDV
jgi:hypothetical protein